ncbi:chemotaxis protein CheW [Vibrio bivalvicida]|uniref:Chemotaxis protein CheW n=1 Tax=Vibrio bivalvicida TaxID=1276888 RepID=A0A177XWL1_9VIBR|nr:chemotaxis protein CheW [Vibrio bivalvicida]OAJ93003.1 chemotaxis protein CheW [Vibrio bivalvicida]
MTNHSSLSSEQALDDYFSALLEESLDVEVSESTQEQTPELSVVPAAGTELDEESNLDPMVQSVEEKSYYQLPTEEVEVPNLEDVERLLEQLENTNPVAELELEEVMEKNTADIAQVQTEIAVEEEEIQEWVVEEPEILVEEPEPKVDVPDLDEVVAEPVISEPDVAVDASIETEQDLETQAGGSEIGVWHSTQRDVDFQVLYFDVNSVTFAVPLDELGGIHRIAELNHLIGRPDWYLGLQTSREAQLDVVDTAKWVMAEKLQDDSYKEQYQYIVMLGASMWGLASTQLMGTEALNPEMVRWRETAGKRPWLAGMVKEKMCALIHVEALIAMLNAGLDVKALDN